MEEKSYTPLAPTDETSVKHIFTAEVLDSSPTDCGQRVPSYMNVNISNRPLVDVNSENVESVFDGIVDPNSETVDSEPTAKLIQLYRDLPKDFFFISKWLRWIKIRMK